MQLQKKPIFSLVLLVGLFSVVGCGVKGDPLPPEKPAEIGRGRPTYKRASEEITIQKDSAHKGQPAHKGQNDDDDDDDGRE
jgi:hypothetical protein